MAISKKTAIIAGIVVGCIGVLLMVILVPLSFGYIDYYEMGLRKGRVNSKVSVFPVYSYGRYLVGPSYVFQKYPSIVQTIYQPNVSCVSTDKLETDIEITIGYQINPVYLGELQVEFNTRYNTVVQSRAISALKNAAAQFTTEQFFTNRSYVSETLHKAIRKDLETNLYVRVPYFYMGLLSVPALVAKKQSQTAVQNQINLQQVYENQAALIRKDTTTLANSLENNATVISETGKTEANSIVSQAKSQAFQYVELIRSQALADMFKTLCIKDAQTMSKLDYILTLIQSPNVNLHVGYDTLFRTLSSGV